MNSIKAFVLATILFANQVTPFHATPVHAAAKEEATSVGISLSIDSLPTETQAIALSSIVVAAPAVELRKPTVNELIEQMSPMAFGPGQVDAWLWLLKHESNGDVHATNPMSGAYGLGQALPAEKMAPYGDDYLDNPETQLKWMQAYIADRYGTPLGAQLFWLGHGWY